MLSVLNGLKNRGVEDILIICIDGLTGIKEAIVTAGKFTDSVLKLRNRDKNTT